MKLITILLLIFSFNCIAIANPLQPVKLDSPRSTMHSYLAAMKDYNEGRLSDREELKNRLDDAVKTLDLSQIQPLIRKERGRELAILLKEVLDRVIIIDLEKIPDDNVLNKWRLKDTEIVIYKTNNGENDGDYLFSKNTVDRIPEFYKRVQHLKYLDSNYQGAGYTEPIYQKWIPEWGKENLLGLKKIQWIGLLVSILLGLLFKKITEHTIDFLHKGIKNLHSSMHSKALQAIERPLGLIVAAAVWYFSIHTLDFEGLAQTLLFTVVQLIFSVALVWAAYRLTDLASDYFSELAKKTESPLDDQLVPLLAKSLRIFVVVTGVLLTVQNLGFNVMSLLAGLGLGGLAFALAAKDTAANFFGSIMILVDRPFKIGDWIISTSCEGHVEQIGFRSTRLRTFYDSVISIPNSVLANEKIDNMGQRNYRRVKATLGLTYDTTPEKLEAFLEGIKNIILAHPNTRKDYFHVIFNGYGAFSLDILVYFFLKVPNWNQELLGKQNVFLEILRLAKEIDVQFAFPTQSLYVEAFPEKVPLRKETHFSHQDLTDKARSFGPEGENSAIHGRGIFVSPYDR